MKIRNMLLFFLLAPIANAEYNISWSTFSGGGGQSSGGQFIITGAIGQSNTDYGSGGNYELLAGFWPGGSLCVVDFEDFAKFAQYWLQSGIGLPADIYGDETVNMLDLKKFAEEWLCYCPYEWPLK
jgi:hypothetical protein